MQPLPSIPYRLPTTPSLALLGPVGAVVLPIVAVLLWVVLLRDVDVRAMTDLGLASVLPLAIWIPLVLLAISFALGLMRPRGALLLPTILAAIFMLYGVTALVEEIPRFHVSWRHVGVSEYISRTGTVDPTLNAYFNWPGFFILGAFISELMGWPDAQPLLAWAPVYFNLLYLPALYLLFQTLTDDRRLIWGAIWLFYLANWIGQDYFAPQALSYFFHLIILLVLLRWFRPPAVDQTTPISSLTGWGSWVRTWLFPPWVRWVGLGPQQRFALLGIILAIYAAIVASHQLTPFFLIAGITGLIIVRRCDARWLPVVMGVMVTLWVVVMANAYLVGHMDKIFGGVGNISENVTTNVTKRIGGSADHLLIVRLRLGLTGALMGLAALGVLRRARHGSFDLTGLVLMAAPFSLVLVQPYGGEMVLRAYFFALPWLSFFAVALLFPSPKVGQGWRTSVAVACLSLFLLGLFGYVRYGNERMDFFTHEEVAAVEYLYDTAPEGSLLVALAESMPWKHKAYEQYHYRTSSRYVRRNDVESLLTLMRDPKYPQSYLIVTRSQQASMELLEGVEPQDTETFRRRLLATGQVEIIFANKDAHIYALKPGS